MYAICAICAILQCICNIYAVNATYILHILLSFPTYFIKIVLVVLRHTALFPASPTANINQNIMTEETLEGKT